MTHYTIPYEKILFGAHRFWYSGRLPEPNKQEYLGTTVSTKCFRKKMWTLPTPEVPNLQAAAHLELDTQLAGEYTRTAAHTNAASHMHASARCSHKWSCVCTQLPLTQNYFLPPPSSLPVCKTRKIGDLHKEQYCCSNNFFSSYPSLPCQSYAEKPCHRQREPQSRAAIQGSRGVLEQEVPSPLASKLFPFILPFKHSKHWSKAAASLRKVCRILQFCFKFRTKHPT